MILIGTSGFSYDDWKGAFYPESIAKSEMLAYYARAFPAVEINSSYYAIPGAASFAAMARKTPESFRFVVKAHKDMTHAETADTSAFAAFLASIEQLRDAGKLGCVLAQYPWGFRPSDESRSRLVELAQKMGDVPTVVEFRNSLWAGDETLSLLRELGLGYCCVDEPHLKGLMPSVSVATSPIGYVRFHGRNTEKWWQHDQAWERYDYLYSEEELAEWLPDVETLSRETESVYLFFNNHYRGKSAQNARMFAQMLSLPIGDLPQPEQPGLFG